MDEKTSQPVNQEAVKTHWDNLALTWDEFSQKRPLFKQTWEEWDFSFRSHLPPPDSSITVLDAGCGVGQFSCLFAQFGYRVKACDLSPNMLDFARKRAESLEFVTPTPPVEFRLASLDQLPYLDSEFDFVWSRAVLDFTARPAYALKELRRVTKAGGKLILATLGVNSPVKQNYWLRFLSGLDPVADYTTNVLNGITPWEVGAILRVVGWKILDQEGLYGASVSGVQNQFSKESMKDQPILFQQVACSVWQLVAEAVEPGPLVK